MHPKPTLRFQCPGACVAGGLQHAVSDFLVEAEGNLLTSSPFGVAGRKAIWTSASIIFICSLKYSIPHISILGIVDCLHWNRICKVPWERAQATLARASEAKPGACSRGMLQLFF